jgi:hypothetical protein
VQLLDLKLLVHVQVTLQLTDRQPVCLGVELLSETHDQILSRRSDCYSVSRHVASSDERAGLSCALVFAKSIHIKVMKLI